MYAIFKPLLLKLLAVDDKPLTEPAGADHASVQVFHAAPVYLRFRLLSWGIITFAFVLAVLAIAGIGLVDGESAMLYLLILLVPLFAFISMLMYFSMRLDYDMRTYLVTDKSLRIRQGAMTVREMTLTYANIQNLKVMQGPIEQLFGFKNLIVETAGGGGGAQAGVDSSFGYHTGLIAGITNAEEIRDLIQARMDKQQTAPKPAAPDQITDLQLLKGILQETTRLNKNLS